MNLISRLKKYLRITRRRNITRSYGLLEYILAIQRSKIANKFISNEHRNGRILDIGCGSYPIFLLTAKFVQKFGIDKMRYSKSSALRRFKLMDYDIEEGGDFTFDDESIDVITMLAVLEHIEYANLINIMSEAYRVLKPNGIFIITVPSSWSRYLLNIMSILRLVSRVEVKDHKTYLKTLKISEVLKKANFSNIRFGYFELFMNRWFIAKKTR